LPANIYGQLAAAQTAAQLNDPLLQATAAAMAANSTSETSPTGSRDTTYTKIFVGGLPYHTSDKTLHDYFKQFGEIEEAVVITDRQTQKSRGYGFVTMRERADAEKACRDPNPIIDGRKANVNLAYLGAKPRTNVQLTALSNTLQAQIPLQAQLQAALLPGRIGLPQLYFQNPAMSAVAAQNALLSNSLAHLQPSLLAAMAQAQAQQNLAAVNQAGNAAHPQQQNYFDYATLAAAAAAAQNTGVYGIYPSVSTATSLEQFGYQFGVLPNTSSNAYAAQLSAAQAQLAVGTGHQVHENQRI